MWIVQYNFSKSIFSFQGLSWYAILPTQLLLVVKSKEIRFLPAQSDSDKYFFVSWQKPQMLDRF